MSTTVGATAALVLQPDPSAVRHARGFVHLRCRAAGVPPDATDAAVLLTSEVVTDAVLHGRSRTRVCVSVHASTVRVEISDDDSRHPVLAPPDDGALDGRGIARVDLLATTWGVRDDDLGTTVRSTLATSS